MRRFILFSFPGRKLINSVFQIADFKTGRSNAKSWKFAALREIAEESTQQLGKLVSDSRGFLNYLLKFVLVKFIKTSYSFFP